MNGSDRIVRVGCAGWAIPKQHAHRFPEQGTHLERYSRRLPAVEINSSFYRSHQPKTYARWAASVPMHFQFSVKVPREITHRRRLADAIEPLERVLGEVVHLGAKLGPLLIQLPPSLRFDPKIAGAFFDSLRERFQGQAVCEPRHATWFTAQAERLLRDMRVGRVAADPAVVSSAAAPGGWEGLVYFRLHGSPEMYSTPYSREYLNALADRLAASARLAPTWCIFDNTALGAATDNALDLLERYPAVFSS